jgi:hypothetical protein
MRLNYLQGGGHDPNILHKFTEMEYDARFRDNNNNNNMLPNRFPPSRPSNQIGTYINKYLLNYIFLFA